MELKWKCCWIHVLSCLRTYRKWMAVTELIMWRSGGVLTWWWSELTVFITYCHYCTKRWRSRWKADPYACDASALPTIRPEHHICYHRIDHHDWYFHWWYWLLWCLTGTRMMMILLINIVDFCAMGVLVTSAGAFFASKSVPWHPWLFCFATMTAHRGDDDIEERCGGIAHIRHGGLNANFHCLLFSTSVLCL